MLVMDLKIYVVFTDYRKLYSISQVHFFYYINKKSFKKINKTFSFVHLQLQIHS